MLALLGAEFAGHVRNLAVMIISAVLAWKLDLFDWLTVAFLGVAVASLLFRRALPGAVVWVTVVLTVSIAAGLFINRFWPVADAAVPATGRICAVLALIWSVAATLVRGVHGRSFDTGVVGPSFVGVARSVALLLGVTAIIVQAFILVMRVILDVVELITGESARTTFDFGFGSGGLWTLGFLCVACSISAFSTRDRRLGTCMLWCATLTAIWACLLMAPFRSSVVGGVRPTDSTLLLQGALAVVLALAVSVSGWVDRRSRWRQAWSAPSELRDPVKPWPGLAFSAVVIAMAVGLLICYHLAVPVSRTAGSFRISALLMAATAMLVAISCFMMLHREWSVSVAEAAMGLTSLGLCALATVAVPSRPEALADRYPMIFNAMIVGLGVATGLWTWLACVWHQQLDGTTAWTTAGRLIPHAKRFAFMNAALALVISAAMAIWPRWPSISTMDHTLGRISAGFAGNLFLLLVMLWCSRRLHKMTFHVLTVLSVVSGAAFLIARMLPFTPRFG